MCKISVVIPAFNSADYLSEAVHSVRSQEWPGTIEVIVIDDGSTDDTKTLAIPLSDRFISLKRGGAAAARNAGIRAASGDFIFLMDADDIATSDSFVTLYEPFQRHSDVMGIFGRAVDFISPDLPPSQKTGLLPNTQPYHGRLTGCSLLRREVFETVGLFDESLKTGETVDWMIRMRSSGLLCIRIDHVTLRRRLHLTNTGRVNRQQEICDYATVLRKKIKKIG